MKSYLTAIMTGLAIGTATQANAAEPPIVDKEAGTILTSIRADKNDTPTKELLSCKYGYVSVTRGQSVHTIDLLQGVGHATIEKRAETARKECKANGLAPAF